MVSQQVATILSGVFTNDGVAGNTLNGTEFDDTIFGNGGDDIIDGLGGADLLVGGAGDDDIDSGGGNDIISGGNSTAVGNTIRARIGDETFLIGLGENGSDIVRNDGGTERISVGQVAQIDIPNITGDVVTQAGNINTLDASDDGAGNLVVTVNNKTITITDHFNDADSVLELINFNGSSFGGVNLGSGDYNLVAAPTGTATLNGGTGNDALFGTTAGDTLNGNAGNDLLLGGGGNNSLNGGADNDILDGGAGADSMTGGAGDDIYVIDDVTGNGNQRDQAIEVAGGGNDTVTGAVNLNLANFANVENIALTGNGNLTATGNNGNNVLAGNSGNNALNGGGGSDTAALNGTALAASFALNGGNVTVTTATGGTDTLQGIERVQFGATTYELVAGQAVAQTLTGGVGDDLMLGFGGNDVINAGGGNDIITWGVNDGRDRVNGGTESAVGVGDTFVINGSNQAETYRIYSNTDDWDNNAGNGVESSAAHAGLTGLAAGTEIVVTRNTNGLGGAVTNTNIIAELTDIEEIVINTGGGVDAVLPIGNFNGTALSFNTITVNDSGGSTTVDVTQLTSAHHVAFHTSGNNDTMIGARPQDEIIPDGGNAAATVSRATSSTRRATSPG